MKYYRCILCKKDATGQHLASDSHNKRSQAFSTNPNWIQQRATEQRARRRAQQRAHQRAAKQRAKDAELEDGLLGIINVHASDAYPQQMVCGYQTFLKGMNNLRFGHDSSRGQVLS